MAIRSLVILCLTIFSVGASAQELLLPLAPYPHASVITDEQLSDDDYQVTLSAYKKVNSRWRSDDHFRVSGQLHRLTLQLDEGQSIDDVFNYFDQQLSQFQGRSLFACKALYCGSSNAWANHHFAEKRLYGLDQYQLYKVVEVPWQGDTIYAVLYSVTRGNKRSYMHVELLRTSQVIDVASSPDAIWQQLQKLGYYSLPNGRDDAEQRVADSHLDSVVQLLNSKSKIKLAFVGHDYGSGSIDEQQQRSMVLAKELQTRLQSKGIKSGRTEVYGLGSLAPRAIMTESPSSRIEIVLLKP